MVILIEKYWSRLTLCLLITIAVASLWPVAFLPPIPGTDKTHHFVAYAALMLPTALKKPKYWFTIAVGFLFFSGAIELIQPYVNRFGEWLDLLANAGGIICGIFIAALIKFCRRY